MKRDRVVILDRPFRPQAADDTESFHESWLIMSAAALAAR